MIGSDILGKPKTHIDRILVLIVFFVFVFFSSAQENVISIKDYGAKGDGKTLNTLQIQKAIDYCSRQGGGKVVVPVGTYLTGTIALKSNIELFLAPGAELIGSPELKDYPKTEHTSEHRNTFLIYASNANKISITGQGTINGNDSAFMDWDAVHPGCCVDAKYTRQGESFGNAFPDGPSAIYGNPDNRPGVLIGLMNCSDVSIRDITIRNAPNWCLHLAGCQNADLRNLKVLNSLLVPNADGIDVSNSKNVNIEDCTIVAGDDGIAISPCGDGYANSAAEDIQVSHCNITSRSAGIRLGYSENDIRNCSFKNLYIQSNRGICINTRHDEIIEDITFEDIILDTRLHTGWWGNGEPIHISEIPLGMLHGISSEGKDNGLIKNIRFRNIDITGESGMVFYGHSPNSILRNRT